MVSRWTTRNPLTIQEREKIKEGLDLNMSYRDIAMHCGRSKTTVMRESKKFGDIKDYDPIKSQEMFEKSQKELSQKISTSLKNRSKKITYFT